ncbi:4-(cytidine 5'-diphospho)-2-C-methyl-D-erythritol kinase [Glycomyces buryatensis]|uniref:4-diphosphocytidyl-2-C-methyl-D-erythritol kinase n=1 Tax=Glycomyces buryatensis TaxID=2570927 RepID=A0A4S8QC45_9ACTN|nr:4-(cytidine 5'-diphospho)-2-C-methyl-D-erythritol kinase [Glycomyces buryatensis]THV41928.1 4-(cytidine 5'-diphospho)-2-C-methyl-D-erythritol kinase [Glycomyces buryatensis]
MTGQTAPAAPSAAVSVDVPAKINPHLGVGDARADGFHALSTVYQSISLYDTVTVERREEPGIELTISGEGADILPRGDENLAVKAAKLIAIYGSVDPDVRIHLNKRIPVAGGLAGGSADAAATLVACSRLWEIEIGDAEMHRLAAGLGSDVPFCLKGGTAVGAGRGEELTRVEVGGSWHWVVATTDTQISTPECFKEVDRLREDGIGRFSADVDQIVRAFESGIGADELSRLLVNDMEAAAVSLRPQLASLMHGGLEEGALAAHVSGSGPTVLFLASDVKHAMALARRMRMRGGAKSVHIANGPVPGPAA